jgi:DegV family protein with EDD domain
MSESEPVSEVSIVTDSIADVPGTDQERLKITVVPAVVTLDGETYQDGVDLSRAEFYRRLPHLKTPATTAAPSPVRFEEAYERLFARGAKSILSIHIPSKLSGLFNVVTQAAKPFGDRVKVFDSGQLSLACGYLAIEAAQVAQDGGTIEMAIERARKVRDNVRLIAFIDNLAFLKRSGRINWLTAGLGNLLKVKLLLEVRDGVIGRLGQIRTRRKALNQLEKTAETWGPLERLAVPHTVIPDIAADFAKRLEHLSDQKPITLDATTAIGAHIGPGALGITCMKKIKE